MKVYNGDKLLLGRLATAVAKDALMGEEVRVVNCENIYWSGNKILVLAHEKQKIDRRGHPDVSAKHSRLPERLVRRSIRGMLPWITPRGRVAFKRIMCYRGIPEELKNEKLITLESASVSKLPTLKYVTVGEICKRLGAKL